MRKFLARGFRIREAGVLTALIFIAAITGIFNHRFFSGANLQILSRQIAILGIIAIGEMFVIITKGIDLSPGSMTAMTCVLVAWVLREQAEHPALYNNPLYLPRSARFRRSYNQRLAHRAGSRVLQPKKRL